jgi:hypothetical protein
MRKIITTVTLAVAALGTAAALAAPANAAVAVTDGAGFVGKGDVQSALGLANDAEMQKLFKAGDITFASTFTTAKDTSWSCTDGTVKHHIFNTTSTNTLNAVANTNGAGKLTNGWNLDGDIKVYGPTTGFTTGDDGTGRFATYTCAGHGSTIFSTLRVDQSHQVGGLQVNGVDLPNTPVEVAPVG